MDKAKARKEWLLAQVSQYIEDHYEGFSYYVPHPCLEVEPACDDSEPEVDCFHDIFKTFAEPCLEVEPSCDDSEPEVDCFSDIFKIFAEPRQIPYESVSNFLNEIVEETFTEYMLRMIAEKGYDETEVYHNVFMDRKLFSKIRNDRFYQPSKRTALLIAIALRLTIPETQELLGKAGFALTHCSKTDLIIEFCIQQGVYDIFEINELLDAFHLPLLMKCD